MNTFPLKTYFDAVDSLVESITRYTGRVVADPDALVAMLEACDAVIRLKAAIELPELPTAKQTRDNRQLRELATRILANGYNGTGRYSALRAVTQDELQAVMTDAPWTMDIACGFVLASQQGGYMDDGDYLFGDRSDAEARLLDFEDGEYYVAGVYLANSCGLYRHAKIQGVELCGNSILVLGVPPIVDHDRDPTDAHDCDSMGCSTLSHVLARLPITPEFFLAHRNIQPKEYPEGRCPVCGWNLVKPGEAGCHVGDCSYRPAEGSPEELRIRARRKMLDERKVSATHDPTGSPLFDPSRMPARDESGVVFHPDLDNFSIESLSRFDGDITISTRKLVAAGFDVKFVFYGYGDDRAEHSPDSPDATKNWNPTIKDGLNWQLVAIYECKDTCPGACFIRKV